MNTLKDLLKVAITQENNSEKLYRFGVDIAQDEETKKFFRQLAEEEKQHANMLYNILETGMYDLDAVIEDPQVLELVSTSHGSDELVLPADLTIEQLLDMAMKREFTAQKRYQKAAELARDPEVVELLENLSREEEVHRLRVEKYFKIHKGLFGEEI